MREPKWDVDNRECGEPEEVGPGWGLTWLGPGDFWDETRDAAAAVGAPLEWAKWVKVVELGLALEADDEAAIATSRLGEIVG